MIQYPWGAFHETRTGVQCLKDRRLQSWQHLIISSSSHHLTTSDFTQISESPTFQNQKNNRFGRGFRAAHGKPMAAVAMAWIAWMAWHLLASKIDEGPELASKQLAAR